MPDPGVSNEGTYWFFYHLRTATGIYPENFMKIQLNLAEIYRIQKKMFTRLFVGFLFIYLFVFCFNRSETPTKSSPENFVKIRLDLAEILS